MGAKVKEITAEQFDHEVLQGGTVVLDFYSTESGPCTTPAVR